jgi:hypothetical protein
MYASMYEPAPEKENASHKKIKTTHTHPLAPLHLSLTRTHTHTHKTNLRNIGNALREDMDGDVIAILESEFVCFLPEAGDLCTGVRDEPRHDRADLVCDFVDARDGVWVCFLESGWVGVVDEWVGVYGGAEDGGDLFPLCSSLSTP